MSKRKKKIPPFKSEEEERKFWQTHDSTDYIDWSKAKHAFMPNLKPSTKTISLRLPEDLLNNIKALANKRDVPYQSYIKMLLDRDVREIRKFKPKGISPPQPEEHMEHNDKIIKK